MYRSIPSTQIFLLIATCFLLGLPPAEARERRLARLLSGERRTVEDVGRGGPKRVEVDISDQRLRAYEGDRLVMQTRVCTGRGDSTPKGRYSAGWKDRHHYSSKYDNAYMPWSVQVAGDVFIHGYSSVPRHPSSHGCIRMPVTGTNPAKRFYEWVDAGTPIRISY